jgi:hypothetical protein
MSYDPYAPPGDPFAPPKASIDSDAGARAGLPFGLGLFGMIAWILPIVGLPVTIWGLVRAIKALSGPNQALAIVAIVLCSLGLVLSVLNMALGVYLVVTGQNAALNQMK